jgi:hypothetical protein
MPALQEADTNSAEGMIFRYVVHERVEEYMKLGWWIVQTNMQHHGYYSVLMNWPCNCKMVEPR